MFSLQLNCPLHTRRNARPGRWWQESQGRSLELRGSKPREALREGPSPLPEPRQSQPEERGLPPREQDKPAGVREAPWVLESGAGTAPSRRRLHNKQAAAPQWGRAGQCAEARQRHVVNGASRGESGKARGSWEWSLLKAKLSRSE